MRMLADLVELVIGVDTHKHTHTVAVVTAATGAVIAQATVAATPAGYRQLLTLANQHQGQRVWAIEGTGGYGAGLTGSCTLMPSKWWSWTGPSEPLDVMAPSPTRWTRPGPPARRWGATSSPSRASRAIARRSRRG
jgi:transposase